MRLLAAASSDSDEYDFDDGVALGELVEPSGCGEVDGCGNHFVGMSSRAGTTVAVVVDRDVSVRGLRVLLASWRPGESRRSIAAKARGLVRYGAQFPVGTLVRITEFDVFADYERVGFADADDCDEGEDDE